MRKYFITFIFFSGLLLPLYSCFHNNPSYDKFADPYIVSLKTSLTELEVTLETIPFPSAISQPLIIEVINNGKNIVAADIAQRKLFLLNNEGAILSETGRSGRGPGEYELISGMYAGYDGRIYVKDLSLRRITSFEVVDSEIRLLDTFVYEAPEADQLISVYVTEHGIFGLFNEWEGFHTPENRYLLYLLDENFNPVEKKLAIPGEVRKAGRVAGFLVYPPHDYSNKYIWHQDGERFYYTNNHEALIKRYHLQTEENAVLFETNLPIRPTNDYYLNAADEAYNFESNREYWSVLENLETLPVLSGMWVDNGHVLLSIRPAPGDEIMMLSLDHGKNQISYFMLPPDTGASTFTQNIFYSVTMDDAGLYHLTKTIFEH